MAFQLQNRPPIWFQRKHHGTFTYTEQSLIYFVPPEKRLLTTSGMHGYLLRDEQTTYSHFIIHTLYFRTVDDKQLSNRI